MFGASTGDLGWPDSIGTTQKLELSVRELAARIGASCNDRLQASRDEIGRLEHDDDEVLDKLDAKKQGDTISRP